MLACGVAAGVGVSNPWRCRWRGRPTCDTGSNLTRIDGPGHKAWFTRTVADGETSEVEKRITVVQDTFGKVFNEGTVQPQLGLESGDGPDRSHAIWLHSIPICFPSDAYGLVFVPSLRPC